MPKKIVEKWRAKEWYSVKAPKMFNEIDLGEVTAASPEDLVNRVLNVSLKDITRDFSHVYTSLKLRISEVQGRNALTKFIGHEIAREWLATMVQRRREVLDLVLDLKSKDGVGFRLKAFIATSQRCSEGKRRALRKAFSEGVRRKAASIDFQQLIQDALTGKLAGEMASRLRRIAPLHRVEIRATELMEEFDVPKKAKAEEIALQEREPRGVPAKPALTPTPPALAVPVA